MKTYNIGGVKIGFQYACSDYFAGRIEKYLDEDSTPDYCLTSCIKDEITQPNGECILEHHNRKVFQTNNQEILCIYDKTHTLSTRITYSLDYHTVEFAFSRALGKALAEIEYVLTGLFFLEIMLREGFLSLHASAIQYKNDAVLFCAPSGTGKSTHAVLWEKHLEGITYINDDKPLIKLAKQGIVVIGSPWSGKTCRNDNKEVLLKAIVFLVQGKINKIIEISNKEKLEHLLRNSYRTRDEAYNDVMLSMIQTLITHIDMFTLECTPKKSAMDASFNRLYKKGSTL